MSIGLIFMMALASVAGGLLLLARTIGWARILRHATLIDVLFTVILCFALAGTLTGLLIGIVAGLIMTGVLTLLKSAHARIQGVQQAYTTSKADPEEDWCPGGSARALTV